MVKKLLHWLDKLFTAANTNHRVENRRASTQLPYDVLIDIFPFLTRKQLSNVQLVNRHFLETVEGSINILHFIASMKNDVRCRKDQPGKKYDGFLFKTLSSSEFFLPLDGKNSLDSLPQYIRFRTVELNCWLLHDKYMDLLRAMRHCFAHSQFILRYRPNIDSLKVVQKFFEEMLTPIFDNCSTYNIYEAVKLNGRDQIETISPRFRKYVFRR